ncbi:MAG: hypothetical protein WAL83_14975, partial [Arenicellales bacterium]
MPIITTQTVQGSLSGYKTEFVSSRGIAAVCDVRPSSMQSDSTALTAADYRNIQDGDLPVMLVDDWNEVDEAALLRFKQSIETSTFNTR